MGFDGVLANRQMVPGTREECPSIWQGIHEIGLTVCDKSEDDREEYKDQKLVALIAAEEAGRYRMELRAGRGAFLP
jgi:hypothetical protein